MTKKTIKKVQECGLFAHLDTDAVSDALEAAESRLLVYDKDRFIAFKGDRYDTLLVVIDGEVSAEISDIHGKVLKVENLTAPSMVAGGILFADDNRLPVNLRAAKLTELIAIPRESLLEMAARDQKVLLKLLGDAGNKIAFLAEKLRFIRMRSLEQKIAVYFTDLHRQNHGAYFRLPYSVEELSELFGVTRPALSRSIGLLVDEGVLDRDGRRYRVADPEELTSRGDPEGR